ncbi:MAG: hypothetical protein ACI9K5_003529 [Gammaproteobacteria bacterium]
MILLEVLAGDRLARLERTGVRPQGSAGNRRRQEPMLESAIDYTPTCVPKGSE